jgi:hypothetical protein
MLDAFTQHNALQSQCLCWLVMLKGAQLLDCRDKRVEQAAVR